MESAKNGLVVISSCFIKATGTSKNTVAKYVPPAISNYVFRHPYLNATTFAVAVPAIGGIAFAAPVLGLVGFGTAGPIGGSAAAAYQSAYGATTMFSVLQSAAMGGYGVPVVIGGMQGVGVACLVVVEWLKMRQLPSG